MSEINRTALFGKLNSLAYKAIEGATGATVSIRKGMDGLELGMSDGNVREYGNVDTINERKQVIHRALHEIVMRRHERRGVRSCRASADPDLLVAIATC